MRNSKMRDSDSKDYNTMLPYQIWKVILTHIEAAGIACIFQMVAFWYFIGKTGFKEILGVLFTLIYMGFIYHVVRKIIKRDINRSLAESGTTETEFIKDNGLKGRNASKKPSIVKGIMFGAVLSVITLLLFAAWKAVWLCSSADESLVGIPATICNLVFSYWTFPYYGLMGASHGYVTLIGMICMIFSPPAASTLGYLGAKNNVDIADIIQKIVYEKSDGDK